MVEAVVKLKATAIISHLPKMSIADAHRLQPVSTIAEVKTDLLAKAQILQSKGLDKEQIILDPGIGFGKTTGLNKELLKFAEFMPDYKVMIGYSRKRFLGGNRMDLKTNLEAAKVAIAHGAAYLRVHDVAGHRSLL
jgi:dihydropteroate synthase